MLRQSLSKKNFLLYLLGLCGIYVGFEFFFNQYAMFGVDEFWFAHRIFQYKTAWPYRDFAPYKTVLGYYILLIPMLFSHNIIQTLILMKNVIAFLNACLLFCSACWLTRFFSKSGILIALVISLLSEITLSYSTNIRVDLLGYWWCFFSLLFLLEKRFVIAGLLLGLGFITSQKTIWYIFATQCVLFIEWLWVLRQQHKWVWHPLWHAIQLNSMLISVILIYLIVWSIIADWHTVFASVFYEAQVMYQLDWYQSARKLFWMNILLYNPLLILLSPLTFLSLCITFPHDHHYRHRLIVVSYAMAILICLIPYKQIFPYYMQAMIPLFFILYAAFLTWLFAIFTTHALIFLVKRTALWAGLITYIIMIIALVIFFHLPAIYLFMLAIPLALGCLLTQDKTKNMAYFSLYRHSIFITLIFIGGIYPLILFGIKLTTINGAYQKANIQTINALLQDDSAYVAGIELIYNKTQPIAGMRHLMGPAIDYLAAPSKKLRTVMLASLYADPNATMDSVIKNLQAAPVKFYVNNYRMMALPSRLKNYLHSHYAHWWGSIYLYAPHINAGSHTFLLKFSGKYLIDTDKNTIRLDKHTYSAHTILHLVQGNHRVYSPIAFRLKLIPAEKYFLNPLFYTDEPYKVIF